MRIMIIVFLSICIFGCGKVKISDYQDTQPTLDLKQFFNGQLKAYGMLQDRQGLVFRKFSADITAHWENNTGYLDETFYFDDGEISTRLWVLTDHGGGRYTGKAGDVVGEAKGQVEGAAFYWTYVLQVPYKDSTIDLRLDDWLYLVSNDRLINKTRLSKFGFGAGELTLVIEKLSEN